MALSRRLPARIWCWSAASTAASTAPAPTVSPWPTRRVQSRCRRATRAGRSPTAPSTPARSSRAIWTCGPSPRTRANESAVHIGEITDTDDFRPWIRLWAPNGAILGSQSGMDAAVIDDVVAPVTGTYLVLVGSFDSGFDGTGTYRLTMTKTPGPITVSPAIRAVRSTNGATHTGEICRATRRVDVHRQRGRPHRLHIGEITETTTSGPGFACGHRSAPCSAAVRASARRRSSMHRRTR